MPNGLEVYVTREREREREREEREDSIVIGKKSLVVLGVTVSVFV